MGLVQNAIEAAGISTVSVTVIPHVTLFVRVPRACYVRFPAGNPFGEAGNAEKQRRILRDMLTWARAPNEPGQVVRLPYDWRR